MIALAVIGAVLVLGAGGCAALVVFGVKTLTAPVDVSNHWLEALEHGSARADELRTITCPSLRSDLGRLQSALDGRGWDGGQHLSSSNIVNGEATVAGTLDLRRGATAVSIHLVRAEDEGDKGWCVDGFHLDADLGATAD